MAHDGAADEIYGMDRGLVQGVEADLALKASRRIAEKVAAKRPGK